MRRFAFTLAAGALAFASCAPSSEPRAPELQSLAVEAGDFKFSGPAEAESGEVQVTLTNGGTQPHQAQLFRMNEDVTVGRLVESAKGDSSGGPLRELGSFAGGPNAVGPGGTQVATVQLHAGRYAFICLVPDAKGRAHLGLGMVAEIDVTQADQEAEAPSADYSSSAKEFSFELPDTWSGTIAFENRGEQPHELQVLGVAKGKTAKDVEASFSSSAESTGPPPWTADGGGAVIGPGEVESFRIDLGPGTYFAMCFVFDPNRQAPHFALGMMQRFQVKE